MKTDFTRILYERYLNEVCHELELTLRNGCMIQGHITGFFKTGDEEDIPYVRCWHIMTIEEKGRSGTGGHYFFPGVFVYSKDIKSIKFLHDNSVLIIN